MTEAHAIKKKSYTFLIDCNRSGIKDEWTDNKITVKWYKGGKHWKRKSDDPIYGVSKKEYTSIKSKFVELDAKDKITKEQANDPTLKRQVTIYGDDALYEGNLHCLHTILLRCMWAGLTGPVC